MLTPVPPHSPTDFDRRHHHKLSKASSQLTSERCENRTAFINAPAHIYITSNFESRALKKFWSLGNSGAFFPFCLFIQNRTKHGTGLYTVFVQKAASFT
jgi:hypothetical protein